MKKYFLISLATIMAAMTLSSCGDDDKGTEEKKSEESKEMVAAKAEVTYLVDLGANTLEFANVEVTYTDEKNESKSIMMTEKQWTLKRTLTASQIPADFSLKVTFEQKGSATPEDDKDYEFGCVSRIPFVVYNEQGKKIADHPGSLTITDGSHPVLKGSQLTGWWLTYALGLNPDKLANFDKKTLTIQSKKAVFNDMDYDYPYYSD